jgi:hypothetical protein
LASFENATFSLNPLSSGKLRAATEKHYPLVQKLWRVRLPCGSLRKTVDEISMQDFAVEEVAVEERRFSSLP